MFYYLRGEVALKDLNMVVIDCGGVGFSVNTTTTTLSYLKTGEEAKLLTYCSIREDAFDIYGFYTKQELEVFKLLISVSGVGPKAALSILSAVSPDGLHTAVITQNDKMLTAAPGIGKKIAQRILLELKDKLGSISGLNAELTAQSTPAQTVPAEDNSTEAMQALQVLGYDQTTITRVMKKIDPKDLSVQDIIKQALKLIAAM